MLKVLAGTVSQKGGGLANQVIPRVERPSETGVIKEDSLRQTLALAQERKVRGKTGQLQRFVNFDRDAAQDHLYRLLRG